MRYGRSPSELSSAMTELSVESIVRAKKALLANWSNEPQPTVLNQRQWDTLITENERMSGQFVIQQPMPRLPLTATFKIVKGWPPNYRQITEHLPIKGRPGLIFCWGDTLYIPSGKKPPQHLLDHELIHSAQQRSMGVELWWRRYVEDARFRLDQELPAHQAEWRSIQREYVSRKHRDRLLGDAARRLSSPLYGSLLSYAEAARRITNGHSVDV